MVLGYIEDTLFRDPFAESDFYLRSQEHCQQALEYMRLKRTESKIVDIIIEQKVFIGCLYRNSKELKIFRKCS